VNFLIIVRVALRSLRRTMLRSGLTALGIIVGVAAVIAMVSIGNGARAQVESVFAGLDSNQLIVTAMTPRSQWKLGVPAPLPRGDGLTVEDDIAINREIPGVALTSVQVFASTVTEAKAHGRRSDITVMGLDSGGTALIGGRLVSGTDFGPFDVKGVASVALISEFVSENLFADEDPVGRLIHIQNSPFTIIGVMADRYRADPAKGLITGDTSVILPYTTLLRRLSPNASMGIVVKADDPTQLGFLQQQVTDLLEKRRGRRKAEFTTGNVAEVVRASQEGSKTMTLLLGAVGGISLLVGGIGIMNIMLVSVTERTREIGIRLAIGTRGRDVLQQFLIEAMILSVIGGTIGVVLGVGAANVITYVNGWPTQVSIESIIGAFLCSAAVGIFFGYYPAREAARLDPIEALRAE